MPIALFLAWLTAISQGPYQLTGVVHDEAGRALPGVAIALVTGPREGTVITDARGRFAFAALEAGTYAVRATLAGFLTETQQARVGESAATTVNMSLRVGTLAEVLYIVPEPREAYRQADAIAHVRIGRRVLPLPCAGLGVVSALHESTVLSEIKGALPDTVLVLQDGAGSCLDGSETFEGMGERSYRSGSEFILFLARQGNRYSRVAGGAYAFAVRGTNIETRGLLGLPELVPLAAFTAILRELAQ